MLSPLLDFKPSSPWTESHCVTNELLWPPYFIQFLIHKTKVCISHKGDNQLLLLFINRAMFFINFKTKIPVLWLSFIIFLFRGFFLNFERNLLIFLIFHLFHRFLLPFERYLRGHGDKRTKRKDLESDSVSKK